MRRGYGVGKTYYLDAGLWYHSFTVGVDSTGPIPSVGGAHGVAQTWPAPACGHNGTKLGVELEIARHIVAELVCRIKGP